MGKEVKSVSLDEDVAEAVDSDESLNLSALVNDFLASYFTTGDTHRSAIEARLEQVEEEIDEKEDELERLRDEQERLEALLEKHEEELEPMLEKATELFAGRDMEPTNPAVETWAMKTGIPADQLLERIEERADD